MLKFWLTVLLALFAWFLLGAGVGIVSGFWLIARAAVFLLTFWVVFGLVLAMLEEKPK
jgi:hypothetical protein